MEKGGASSYCLGARKPSVAPKPTGNLARGNNVLNELKRRTPVGMLDRLTVKRTENPPKSSSSATTSFCAWGSLKLVIISWGARRRFIALSAVSYSERSGEIAHWKAVADSLFFISNGAAMLLIIEGVARQLAPGCHGLPSAGDQD